MTTPEDGRASPREEPIVTRIDCIDGMVDDVAISHVEMFRLEQMDAGSWWMMVYTARGNYRFSLYTKRNTTISCTHEVELPNTRGEANP
jgi:hypothetical protein